MNDEPIDLELAFREAAELTNEELIELLEEHVRHGNMEHGPINANGEQTYRMTEQGTRKAQKLIDEAKGSSD